MQTTKKKTDYRHLIAGGIAASLTTSICCLGPLALLATGVSGAWMSNLMFFERYQPILIAVILLAFVLAGRNVFFTTNAVGENDSCQHRGPEWKKASVCAGGSCLACGVISSEYWILFLV